jgi:penicillin V acylase-like amidase (Ntn superfamily)
MQFKKLMMFAVFVTVLNWSSRSLACSAFYLKGHDCMVIGFNENWSYLPGMVMVNKRGLEKDCIGWSDLVATNPPGSRLHWKAKWGSVTFTCMGIDLPSYGLNEAGLFVVELALHDTRSLPDPSRPNMFYAQWIQYQIDNFASVEELVANLPTTPVIDWWPKFEGSHFFVADARGRTAAIELIDGKLAVSTGERMKVPVLCNGPYQQELAELGQYQPFGGVKTFDLASKPTWATRFIRLAHRLADYHSPPEVQPPVEFAFKTLDEATAGVWQLVVNETDRTLFFRTGPCRTIKSIDLRQCDFSTNSPIRFADLHLNVKGDIASLLAVWTPEINQSYVMSGFPAAYTREDFYRSPEYRVLLRNLHDYADRLQRQVCVKNAF